MSRDGTLKSGTGAFDLNFDWKGEYFGSLTGGDQGYEDFSQLSAAPDCTAIYAGPPRFSSVGSTGVQLYPVGLVQSISLQSGVANQRLFEIGSNRSFFTRGKAAPSLTLSKMLADQKNIIASLLTYARNDIIRDFDGSKAPGNGGADASIMLNLDSEFTNVPFGVLLVMKTKGGKEASNRGKTLAAVYLELCVMDGFGFSIDAVSPAIQEGVSIQFDRIVPVDIE